MFAAFANLSIPAHFVGIIVIFLLVGLLILVICQKAMKPLHFVDHVDFGAFFFAAIGTVFALIFVFVTIAVWENYNRVGDFIWKEATTLGNIYRNLDGYPPEIADAGRQKVKAYVHEVVEREWPLLAQSKQDPRSSALLKDFGSFMVKYRPGNLGELPLHNDTLRQLSNYQDLRDGRYDGMAPKVDNVMATVLIASFILMMLHASMFKMPSMRVHVFMLSVLSVTLGVFFFLVAIYNRPFAGPVAFSAKPFQQLLIEVD